MLALPATSNATPSLQGTLNRSRAEATRRAAAQLENQAQNLRAQADQQETASATPTQSLALQAPQKAVAQEATYTAQMRSAKTTEVPPKTQDFLLRMYGATSPKFTAIGNALKTDSDTTPVQNTQGQTTGRILNLQA